MGTEPLEALEAAQGDVVTVQLKTDDEVEGELVGFDQHMNLVVEGDNTTIIRGDNVVSIKP